MIPFPGQSVGVIDAYGDDGRGWDLYEDVQFRGRGTDRTINAGTNWYAFAYHRGPAESLLEAGDSTPLAVSWVVEVLSGTGVLALADLDDTGYSEPTTPGAYPNALGSITVTGAGTYTLPTSTFTADAIRTAGIFGGALAVHIACTSGAVLVAQVKLRAWPATGPLGAWSDAPYTGEPMLTPVPTYRYGPSGNYGDDYTSQDAFRAAIAASTTVEPYTVSDIVAAGDILAVAPEGEGVTPTVNGGPAIGYIYRPSNFGRVGPGTLGVDYAYPPAEVAGDADTILYQPTGPDTVAWLQGTARVDVTSRYRELGNPVFSGTVSVYTAEVAAPHPAGTSTLSILSGSTLYTLTPTGSADILTTVALPEFAVDKWLRVAVDNTGFHVGIADNAGSGATLYQYDDASNPLRYQWTPAPYYWWDPNGTPPADEDIPRQWRARPDGLAMSSTPSWRRNHDTAHSGQWRGPV